METPIVTAHALLAGSRTLLTVGLSWETDVVAARQRARQLARLLGFGSQDQIRLATATSEIARNVIQYAGRGRVEFAINADRAVPRFIVHISDSGPGISNPVEILDGSYESKTGLGIGLTGTRRIMDHFVLESMPGAGTRIVFAKDLPPGKRGPFDIAAIATELARDLPKGAEEELRQQNREALATIDLMRQKETELRGVQNELLHLNQELEATNRGVVALYAELDQRAEALRTANEIKTRFLSHMSHEFRTPLNSILALTNLLLRRSGGELSGEQEKQVGYIRYAAEELFEMVNDLLDLAKVEAGKLEIKYSKPKVAELLGVLRGMLRPLSITDAVSLTIGDVDPALQIRTDEGKLAQILRNLVANALKFTEAGEVRVSVECEGSTIRFRVSDTGIGIAPNHRARIFEEFAQIDNSLQRRSRGTGLGLPLSRKLAELLGGTLTVESAIGAGSTFTLTLPLDRSRHDDPARLGEDPEAAADCILVIDDSERDRYLVRQILRDTPYLIVEASNGPEGTERARFERPRLIVLDLVMPGMSGLEVLDELKADPLTASIPVVIHTSAVLSPAERIRIGDHHADILPKGDAAQERGLQLFLDLLNRGSHSTGQN